jgi:UDP-N-acetylglucosamine 2-epimerase (non-hydrolysing)
MTKIAVILGTRPEIIKMSPVIRALARRKADYFLLHTGQHYSYAMDRVFFEDLELPDPRHNLDVGSGSHGAQTGKMLAGIESILVAERPDVALVQGDTNTVVAGALAASKLGVHIGHVEAGLRSYDRTMPEEINRIVADHISDALFAPTEAAKNILLAEGIAAQKIHVTGNTIVDAVLENRNLAEKRSQVLQRLGVEPDGFILMTAHRQENVDDPRRFAGILEGATLAGAKLGLPVIYPVHPRAKRMISDLGLEKWAANIRLIDPVNFLDFLRLETTAKLILSDSGGVQEEACILRVPCVTLRDNTERPETIEVGANVLAGADAQKILAAAEERLRAPRDWAQPFGEGKAGEHIAEISLSL